MLRRDCRTINRNTILTLSNRYNAPYLIMTYCVFYAENVNDCD